MGFESLFGFGASTGGASAGASFGPGLGPTGSDPLSVNAANTANAAALTAGAIEANKQLNPDGPDGPIDKSLSDVERQKLIDTAQTAALRATLAARGREAAVGDRASILGATRASTRRTLGGF